MCGIFGAYSGDSLEPLERRLLSALDSISHRGPDSFGSWFADNRKLFLGHRRLAIIDLSPSGHQPMHSASGRFTISFNGEIYNFQTLKKELELVGVAPTSPGDTAVMLACFETWGIEVSLSKFVGMFAFAVWDAKEQTLTLARDRVGEKPLYYAWKDGFFVFASELGPIFKSATSTFDLNPTAIGHLLKFGYVPAPLSILKGVFKLPAAATLTLNAAALSKLPENFDEYFSDRSLSPKRYWNLADFVGITSKEVRSENDCLLELEKHLKDSVSGQMISDVPLGAFLSGGVDSSTIVAVMQSMSQRPIKTFSIGFDKASHDEAPFAKAVAKHLGTEHTELYVSEQDALAVIPQLPLIYSEPFGDSSQIPTYLVSKLTRHSVTVSLSGDGGDEVFGGYQRYLWTQRLWNFMKLAPAPLRNILGKVANVLPTSAIESSMNCANQFLPNTLRLKNAGFKIQRALTIGSAPSPEDLYLVFLSQKLDPVKLVKNFKTSKTFLSSVDSWPKGGSLYDRLMWMDIETYLPDDIFVKVDRASMAVALETRAPFLDHRLIEFAFGLPMEMRIRGTTTKYLLRKLLKKYVPDELIDRPKMGFGIPVSAWLCGQLRPWVEDLLSDSSLKESGVLNEQSILEVWQAHLAGNQSNQYFLWHVLMFQAWFRQYRQYLSI